MGGLFSFSQLAALAPSLGVTDVPCPVCAPLHNPRRNVLRIWRERDDFIGFACARCAAKGWARTNESSRPPSPGRLAEIRRDAAERRNGEVSKSRRKARWLWSTSQPIMSASPAATYLRVARKYRGPIPNTVRYLAPRNAEHRHAVIAAFGQAKESINDDARSYVIDETAVAAVHLTLLEADGSSKARDVGEPKIIIGQESAGLPLCLFPPNNLLGLVIAEGLEDALSIHEATGLGAWAAGCANRLPALAASVPSWVDCVTVLMDGDAEGEKHAPALQRELRARGIHCELVKFAEQRAAL